MSQIYILIVAAGKDGNGSGPHAEIVLNAWFLAFFIEITTFSVAKSIDTEIPCARTCKLRKCNRHIFPVCIDDNVDQIVSTFALVIACKTYSEGVCVSWNRHILCINVVGVDIFHTAHCIWKLTGDNRMIFSELDHKFEKFEKIMIFLKKMPVDPGSFVILTVSVVISVFGVSEFVTCKEHRSSTAGHENCTGIADHAEAERKNFRVGGSLAVSALRIMRYCLYSWVGRILFFWWYLLYSGVEYWARPVMRDDASIVPYK